MKLSTWSFTLTETCVKVFTTDDFSPIAGIYLSPFETLTKGLIQVKTCMHKLFIRSKQFLISYDYMEHVHQYI